MFACHAANVTTVFTNFASGEIVENDATLLSFAHIPVLSQLDV